MRKPVALLLIILLSFNILGYYGVFLGWQYHNTLSTMRHLDEGNYRDTETVTFKIPIAIPYVLDPQVYQRVDGVFEHQGEFYRLVKQKLAHDTLYVVCLKDHENRKIEEALDHIAKSFAGNPIGQHPVSKLLLSFIKDYISCSVSLSNNSAGWSCDIVNVAPLNHLTSAFCTFIIQPPEHA